MLRGSDPTKLRAAAAAGKDGRFRVQLFPVREAFQPVGWGYTLVCERADLEALAAKLTALEHEVPVYLQHSRVTYEGNPKPSLGWVADFEVDDEGLWGMARWLPTPVYLDGTPTTVSDLIRTEQVKYLSPGFTTFVDAAGNEHPQDLVELSLTNEPAIQGMSRAEASVPRTKSPAQASARKEKRMDPKKLRALLGLAETASDEETNTALEGRLTPTEAPPVAEQIATAVTAAVAEIRTATAAQIEAEYASRDRRARVASLMARATAEGKVVADNRERLERQANANADDFEAMLPELPVKSPVKPWFTASRQAASGEKVPVAALSDPDVSKDVAARATSIAAEKKISYSEALASLVTA